MTAMSGTTDTRGWDGWRTVLWLGIVSLLVDLVYEGARSITGPFLASLGASALTVGLVTGAGEAAALGERLRTAVEAYWFRLRRGLRVTVSIGLAADVTVADHEKLLARADARLYEAKRAGKNRVH